MTTWPESSAEAKAWPFGAAASAVTAVRWWVPSPTFSAFGVRRWICTIPLAHPKPRNTVSSEKARAVTRELTPAIWINVFFVIASTTCTCPRCWPIATLVPSAVAAAAEARLELSTGSSTFKPEARSATRTALSVTTAAFGVFDARADCSNGGSRTALTL